MFVQGKREVHNMSDHKCALKIIKKRSRFILRNDLDASPQNDQFKTGIKKCRPKIFPLLHVYCIHVNYLSMFQNENGLQRCCVFHSVIMFNVLLYR